MEITIKSSIIDYIGELKGGVAIHISLTLEDKHTFEAVYWIHPDGRAEIEIDEIFVSKLFGSETVEELPFYDELMEDIDSILPDKNELFGEFIQGFKKEDDE